MAKKWAQGKYIPKHPEKYVGKGNIIYRSSWEFSFMNWCDNNSSVLKWASEPLRIPYRDPFTGKNTSYVPDFFIQYLDKDNKIHTEIIEIKPEKQQLMEKAGRSKINQQMVIKNQAKWAASSAYCKQNGLIFRVLNENNLFHTGKSK
jgi:hypothetical protein